MKDLINVILFLKNNMPFAQLKIGGTLIKIIQIKDIFILLKNECTRKAWISAIAFQGETR